MLAQQRFDPPALARQERAQNRDVIEMSAPDHLAMPAPRIRLGRIGAEQGAGAGKG